MGQGKTKPTYTVTFYERYSDYLLEKSVRASHDKVFAQFANSTKQVQLCVVDLGCALGEYSRYGSYDRYVGVDINDTGRVKPFVKADYTDLGFVHRLPFMPNAFVSLFSIEPMFPPRERYALYNALFERVPSIEYALVGGFFYDGRRMQEMVTETGGLMSYQTIEDPSEYRSKNFSERRIYLYTPSQMFGRDVVEVWKILARRGSVLEPVLRGEKAPTETPGKNA